MPASPPPIPKKALGRTTGKAKLLETETFGAYTVYEPMGEGGMARVHRAERVGPDGTRRTVALKRMWEHLSEDRDFVESFIQEARLASLLRHPNVAQAYELGKVDDTYYIAMELVPGPTLNDVMIQSRTAAGAMPLPIVVEILIQLCDALDHAHNLHDEHGRALEIIHRDVSPANVIVSSSGVVKLIDFGVAKAARSNVHTQHGFIKGKLSYVAPEYTLGQLDRRADLFAVGVIAHEMLSGRRLFLADTDIETVHNIREKPIQPPSRTSSQVTPDLDDIVMTALQRDPNKRWQNAAAMRAALVGARAAIGTADANVIREWVSWAFTREPWRDSIVVRLVETLVAPRESAPILVVDRAPIAPRTTPTVVASPRRAHAPTLRVERLRGATPRESAPILRIAQTRPSRDSTPTIVDELHGGAMPQRTMVIRPPSPRSAAPQLALVLIATALAAAGWYGWLDAALAAL
ncbi:MAG: serine/threonine protein kinase [Myxococcales bacterium]|nr:serine/threonine protein kinase [Myxococcales bacterium]